MKELRTLPKDYIKFLVVAVMLAVMITVSIGILLVGGISAYLHHENYSLASILLYAIIVWVVYILLLVGLLLWNKKRIKQKQAQLMHVMEAEFMAAVALRGINVMLRKWRKHETP